MKLLAYAMDYWSKGTLKALFLEHEVKNLIENSYFKIPFRYYWILYFDFRVILARWDVYYNLMANRIKRNKKCWKNNQAAFHMTNFAKHFSSEQDCWT